MEVIIMKSLGNLLKEYRKQHDLTQLQMAELLQLSVGGYQKFERNERTPRIPVLKKISKNLNIPLQILIESTTESSLHRPGKVIKLNEIETSHSDNLLKNLSDQLRTLRLNADYQNEFNSKVKELLDLDYVNTKYKINKDSISENQIIEIASLLEKILELKLAQIKLSFMEDTYNNGKT